MAFAAVVTPIEVYAQNTNLGVNLLQITPSEATGPVGSSVNVIGTLYTSNGSYQLFVGRTLVASGKSQGYYVETNFIVPQLLSGPYALILRDVAININSTKQFTVTTNYAINAVPSSVQEGDNVVLNVSVSGGKLGTSYSANVGVALPSPLSTVYTKSVTLGNPNEVGTASAQVTFPGSSFLPSGSLTDYAGIYTVYFNQSQSLAQNTFAVNFIDSTTPHRGQTVNVRATAYQANEPATLTVTNVKSETVIDTVAVTATVDGVISTSWVVSANADVGDYTIKITPQNAQKSIPDTQTFAVPGYSIKVQTNNLAGQAVGGIVVSAIDESTKTVYNVTSDSNGVANFKLELGTAVLTAFWNAVNVGEESITVSGDATFILRCQLTNIKITVKNTIGTAMPFVDLNIAYHYQSNAGTKTGSAKGQTDSSGSYTLTSGFAGATYTIDASIYNQVFNSGNNSVSNLPTQATAQIFIICPIENLSINILGFNQEPIPNARIELVELSNGLFYSALTDNNGFATTQATFGMYRARVYKDTTLINETNVNLFNSSSQQIHCTLYGIQLSVDVVDFFGAPISNANVTLNGPVHTTSVTQSNGKATFNNIIGGNMQIIAQVSGTQGASQAITVTVNEPSNVQIKIDKYVTLGSILIQTSALFTTLVILIIMVLFVIIEVYRRKRVKHASAT
jgi:Carboxypeptidase regulatory-like domain